MDYIKMKRLHNNRYWINLFGGGYICDICGEWIDRLQGMKRKEDNFIICRECYLLKKYKNLKQISFHNPIDLKGIDNVNQ